MKFIGVLSYHDDKTNLMWTITMFINTIYGYWLLV